MPASPNPDAFTYPGNSVGLLLIHGFTGSAAEMRPMGAYFHERGYTVHARLLAGHGTSPDEMLKTRWPDWRASVEKGLTALQRRGCKQVFAAGLSMGGTLVLDLAQRTPISGVIARGAPIKLKDKRHFLAPCIHNCNPYLHREEVKPAHIEEAIVPYDRTPIVCVASLNKLNRKVRRRLTDIHIPAFVAQARQDETVEPSSAETIYNRISSKCKQLHWYEHSSHILTLDHEKEQLFKDVERFINMVAPSSKRVH